LSVTVYGGFTTQVYTYDGNSNVLWMSYNPVLNKSPSQPTGLMYPVNGVLNILPVNGPTGMYFKVPLDKVTPDCVAQLIAKKNTDTVLKAVSAAPHYDDVNLNVINATGSAGGSDGYIVIDSATKIDCSTGSGTF
jgi:hypothetical protein